MGFNPHQPENWAQVQRADIVAAQVQNRVRCETLTHFLVREEALLNIGRGHSAGR